MNDETAVKASDTVQGAWDMDRTRLPSYVKNLMYTTTDSDSSTFFSGTEERLILAAGYLVLDHGEEAGLAKQEQSLAEALLLLSTGGNEDTPAVFGKLSVSDCPARVYYDSVRLMCSADTYHTCLISALQRVLRYLGREEEDLLCVQ